MFDAVVIGAGPSGAAFALALARRGLTVCMLERASTGERGVGETIPGFARQLLGALGLDDDFARQGHRSAYEFRSYWGSSNPIERNSVFNRYGPGFHLDRAAFDAWLLEQALAAGAVLEKPVEVCGVERRAAGFWHVEYRSGNELRDAQAGVLVDATGRSAWVARRIGGERRFLQRMVGVARWFGQSDLEPVTVVEATADGWWYSAPLPGDVLVLVWITTADGETARSGRSAALWQRSLAAAPVTRARAENARALDAAVTRVTGPALTRWPLSTDFLPIGDAACSFDPVSGAGICFALRSGIDAASIVEQKRSGTIGGFAAYRDGVVEVMRGHLLDRRESYLAERRFRESPFWNTVQRDLTAELLES